MKVTIAIQIDLIYEFSFTFLTLYKFDRLKWFVNNSSHILIRIRVFVTYDRVKGFYDPSFHTLSGVIWSQFHIEKSPNLRELGKTKQTSSYMLDRIEVDTRTMWRRNWCTIEYGLADPEIALPFNSFYCTWRGTSAILKGICISWKLFYHIRPITSLHVEKQVYEAGVQYPNIKERQGC